MTTEIALLQGNAVVASAFSGRKFSHSEVINILFDTVLKTADVTVDDIGYAAVSIGPGFFTALRVGLSFVKALAFARNIKVIPVNTLDALAMEVSPQMAKRVISAIDAQKNEVYYAVYEYDGKKWTRITDYSIGKPDDLHGRADIFVGGGAIKYDLTPRLFNDPSVPSARVIGLAALEVILRNQFVEPDILEPFYIRLPDAVVNKLKKEKEGK